MILTQIEMQEAVDPNRRDPGVLEHFQELLIGAESAYADNYNTLEVVSAEEEQAYVDFEMSANDSRARINVMLEQNRAFQLCNTLHLEITDWEESDISSLSRTFPKQYPDIQRRLAEFRSSSCTSGGYRLPILHAHSKNLRKRLTKLIELATQDTPDSAPTTEVRDVSEDSYCRDKTARMVPLPTFEGDLADWRSFWRRFQDYVGKLHHIADDEQLIYLQDCLIDPTAQDIVVDSIRNGDSFEEVEKRLQRKYDQPTPPLSHSHSQDIRRNEQDKHILCFAATQRNPRQRGSCHLH